jgi:hypothetical protein
MVTFSNVFATTIFLAGFVLCVPASAQQTEKNNFEDWSVKPPVVAPGTIGSAPSDAVILFSGNGLSMWESFSEKGASPRWETAADFVTAAPGAGDIVTKRSFGDCQLHIEWMTPKNEVQSNLNHGNSGIYFMGLYELQIYSSFNDVNKIYYNGQAGSIYKQHRPLVNACLPDGVWQTFDVVFTAPRFSSDSSLVSPAFMTVFHNGVLIQNHTVLTGPTTHGDFTRYRAHSEKLPLLLQEHKSRVSYRNIWIREL